MFVGSIGGGGAGGGTPLTDGAITTGTSTTPGTISPAQAKLSAQTFGTGTVGVASLGAATGAITLGTNLTVPGNVLTLSGMAAQAASAVAITGGSVTGITDITVADGGTGRSTGTTAYSLVATGTTATGAQQTLASGATTEVLVGGGASALPVWTTATGSGSPVRATSPSLVMPALGTPSSGNLANCTGLPAAGVINVNVNRLNASGNAVANTTNELYGTTAAQTVTLPTMANGDILTIDNTSTQSWTVARNSQTINGSASNDTLATGKAVSYYYSTSGALRRIGALS